MVRIALILAVALSLLSLEARGTRLPNVVIIHTDDQG